ncbi:hypothetical protein P4234_05050 [Pseudomonas aeruginosa]|nr:hypothetical protein [Pseudomonas aeruginosa]
MRYARHASRYSLFALAVSAALLPGAGWAANGDLAGARKPPSVACSSEPRGSVVLRGAPARHAAAVQRRQRRHP